jgi:hypothetical protein
MTAPDRLRERAREIHSAWHPMPEHWPCVLCDRIAAALLQTRDEALDFVLEWAHEQMPEVRRAVEVFCEENKKRAKVLR